ncbi:hypothetical protein HGRIS_013803 [Hohenbuehelia grisea]|uniref:RING-type domain-containing protein n=1 Tax=Hohenbuehelia grisea TaxID=104357 RepID=A0ABR3IWR2_9AGAR
MVKLECAICFETLTLDQFRFLKCGHGFCVGCNTEIVSKKVCPICNAPKKQGDAHAIFASFIVSPAEKVAQVVEGLGQIDDNTPSGSVKKAGKKIRDALAAKPSEDTIAQLLSVAEGLEERIYPVYAQVEALTGENKTLKAEAKELRKKCQEAAARKEKLKQLNDTISTLEAAANLAQRNAQEDYETAEKLRKKVIMFEKKLEAQKQEISRLTAENKSQHMQLDLNKRKLKTLAKQTTKQKRALEEGDADDSLQVIDVDAQPTPPALRRSKRTGSDSGASSPVKKLRISRR